MYMLAAHGRLEPYETGSQQPMLEDPSSLGSHTSQRDQQLTPEPTSTRSTYS